MTAVPDESFADAVKMLVNSSTFSVVFDGLEEFVVYRFTISARTEVGFGPTSPEVSNRTDEAGKHAQYARTCRYSVIHAVYTRSCIHVHVHV